MHSTQYVVYTLISRMPTNIHIWVNITQSVLRMAVPTKLLSFEAKRKSIFQIDFLYQI